jgi:protein-disulfide isomerase
MTLRRRALLVSGLAAVASPVLARAKALPPKPGDMVLGSPKAPMQLVVYASASCPHCAHWWTTEQPKLRQALIDTGKVQLVFREFLTPPQEFAAAGFLLSRAVPGKYFEVLTAVFQRQQAIYDSDQLFEGLQAIGKQFGLTDAQFKAALSDQKALDAVNARFRRAMAEEQVEVTPTFFVNGGPYEGEADFATLSKVFAVAAKG